MLLDGTNGAVTLNPDESTIRQFNDLVERQLELAEEATRGAPAGTLKSGGDIPIYANIHPGVPLAGIREQGARGIGLYRSEYLWFNRDVEPTEDEQFAVYRDAAKFAADSSETGFSTSMILLKISMPLSETVCGAVNTVIYHRYSRQTPIRRRGRILLFALNTAGSHQTRQ